MLFFRSSLILGHQVWFKNRRAKCRQQQQNGNTSGSRSRSKKPESAPVTPSPSADCCLSVSPATSTTGHSPYKSPAQSTRDSGSGCAKSEPEVSGTNSSSISSSNLSTADYDDSFTSNPSFVRSASHLNGSHVQAYSQLWSPAMHPASDSDGYMQRATAYHHSMATSGASSSCYHQNYSPATAYHSHHYGNMNYLTPSMGHSAQAAMNYHRPSSTAPDTTAMYM